MNMSQAAGAVSHRTGRRKAMFGSPPMSVLPRSAGPVPWYSWPGWDFRRARAGPSGRQRAAVSSLAVGARPAARPQAGIISSVSAWPS